MSVTALHPVPVSVAPVRRLAQLFAGLWLYGASIAMEVRAGLGLGPWAVLNEGVSERTGLSFGLVTAIIGALVLLCWIPLRQKPGIGTVSNVVVIGIAVDVTLWLLPAPEDLVVRGLLLVVAIVLNGLATAAYVGARLGTGPRDGLWTGICARTGASVRLVRTLVELTVLVSGWLLGGTVGIGTALYALGIGPISQFFLPRVTWREPRPCPQPAS